jgi:diguanylate cyclase
VLGRYGGEEFLALLPETGIDGASVVAQRVRLATASLRWPELSAELAVSVSIGVAELGVGESTESLLRRADEALYGAKRAGRDRVERAKAAATDG